jgi:Protein of unknown function (DUF3147)
VKPRLTPDKLKKVKWWEYAIRFVFGGAITVLTGLLNHWLGPAVAGMFLAFPAILPASLTLVKQHDGRKKAADDARGARLGAIGLVAFAVVVGLTANAWAAAAVLAAATVVWLAVSLLLFAVVYGPRPET